MVVERVSQPSSSEPTGARMAGRPVWARYGVALGTVLLAWYARQALTHAVGPTALPFVFFFPAVAVAAWWGGFVPGLMSVALSSLLANWSFMRPTWTLTLSTYDLAAVLAFAASCMFILGAIEMMHRARASLHGEV
ncbi:MAG TPA: DUF4118 domain-containing protein, partial [Tepidiformaceae bacterium]|nr:DUF4118 domain-containing protein [Tepidiformaceae bacterium]